MTFCAAEKKKTGPPAVTWNFVVYTAQKTDGITTSDMKPVNEYVYLSRDKFLKKHRFHCWRVVSPRLPARTRTRQKREGRAGASSCRCCLGARVKGPASSVFLGAAAEDQSGGYGVKGSMARCRHGNLPTLPSEASNNIIDEIWGFIYISRRVCPKDMVLTSSPFLFDTLT